MAAFVTAVVSVFQAIGTFLASSSIGALLARTVIMGLVSAALTRTIAKKQQKTGLDPGARFQLAPQTNHKIPVLYGTAVTGGIITDGVLTNSNKTMSIAMAISEESGPLLSDGTISNYTFKKAYLNTSRVVFKNDGITVDYTIDADGNEDRSMSGLIKVYMYSGDAQASSQICPDGYSGPITGFSQIAAKDVFGDGSQWTTLQNMSDLLFAVIKVDYNRDKNVTSIGEWQFQVSNSCTQPGDCMFDYMTNTRYGAGIAVAELSASDEDLADIVNRLDLTNYPWVRILTGGSTYSL